MNIKDNSKNNFNISNLVGYIIFVVLFIILVSSAIYFSKKDISDTVVSSISYKEEAGIGYKVYYQENPFYSDPYLLEGKTYISKYIDRIDIDYSYLVNYDDKLSGAYDYIIKAKLLAYAPGKMQEELWSREYQILENQGFEFKNEDSYEINENVSINYQAFKEEYDNYRNDTAITTEGILIIELSVANHGEYDVLDNFDYESLLRLEIPVSDETLKINSSTTVTDQEKTISKTEDADFERSLVVIIAGLLWGLAAITSIAGICYSSINRKKMSYYEKKLKKILDTHDSIIVNVENLPSLSGLNVVDVTTFDELLDAQSEVRLPINFMENKKRRVSKFILIKDKLAWVYTLKEGDEEK
ncbi:MAG: hypothetical protein J1F35_05395 [Erysipelotrichales bacterium]|nr:hypothetical protein [Erysipelotrichales bacterium]